MNAREKITRAIARNLLIALCVLGLGSIVGLCVVWAVDACMSEAAP